MKNHLGFAGLLGGILPPVKKPKPKTPPERGKAKRLAKKLGIKITVDRIGNDYGYWIDADDNFETIAKVTIDEAFEERYCGDWFEVFEKLKWFEGEIT